MKTITFKDGECTSDDFDKTIFGGETSAIIRIVSIDSHDDDDVIERVIQYIQENLKTPIYFKSRNCTTRDGDGVFSTKNGFETMIQISLH